MVASPGILLVKVTGRLLLKVLVLERMQKWNKQRKKINPGSLEKWLLKLLCMCA